MAKRMRHRSAEPERAPNQQSSATKSAEAAIVATSVLTSAARPAPEAVSLFERAMRALQRHQYSDGADAFRGLLSTFPREGALCERSLVSLAVCERELSRHPAEPRTLEERLTAATAALNDGDDSRAETLAQRVLSDAPEHDLALYLLAAVEARRGATDEALHLLSRAMTINPEIRAQARHDEDFEDLRDMEAFRDLIDSPPPPAPDTAHRLRRSR